MRHRSFVQMASTLFVIMAFTPYVASAGQQPQRPDGVQTVTGTITDALCGAKHGMQNMSAADCTRMCVKVGQNYVLATDKNIYTLKGHEADLDKYAGQRVTVKGAVNGKNMMVQSVILTK